MNNGVKEVAINAMIACVYAALTIACSSIAYGGIQFRISEILVLLAVFDPLYIGGLTLGCLIANLLCPNGPLDVILGTLATFISVYAIYLTGKIVKNYRAKLLIASIWPTLFNGLIIGWMLNMLYGFPLVLSMGQVALGELVVITCIGVPLFLLAGSRFKNAMTFK